MNLIKLSLNCIISTIIYSYLQFFSWEVTKTACQVVRFFVCVKAPLDAVMFFLVIQRSKIFFKWQAFPTANRPPTSWNIWMGHIYVFVMAQCPDQSLGMKYMINTTLVSCIILFQYVYNNWLEIGSFDSSMTNVLWLALAQSAAFSKLCLYCFINK